MTGFQSKKQMAADKQHNLDATVFVYKHYETGQIKAEYIDAAKLLEDDPDWEHLATLEPRMWIECHYAEVEAEQAPDDDLTIAYMSGLHDGKKQRQAVELPDLTDAIEYADARWSGVDVPVEWLRHFVNGLPPRMKPTVKDCLTVDKPVLFVNEAMKQALEALHGFIPILPLDDEAQCERYDLAITSLQKAIAEAEKQEHVAWMRYDGARVVTAGNRKYYPDYETRYSIPLYTSPPQRKQEPVAIHQFRLLYCADWYDGVPDPHDGHGPYEVRTLYTSPPQRQWVGLTEQERNDIEDRCEMIIGKPAFDLIEDRLKERNT